MRENTPYNASLNREPFMFAETKIVAELLGQGLSGDQIIEKVYSENLFQYPTEKSLVRRTKACLKRLEHLDRETISWIVNRPADVGKQVCLYGLMKDSRLIYEFMLTVIGEKYRTQDFSYSRDMIKSFLRRLQEQNDQVSTWSDSTINRLSSVIGAILREVNYIDSYKSTKLNEFLIDYKLKDKIIANKDANFLPAFNCFEVI